LSTAKAVGRSKEVGVKKVLGGTKGQLFRQLMGETFIVVLTAVILAIILATICCPILKA
jgi:ABC-type antimicrobial peptide transport system permease subunit